MRYLYLAFKIDPIVAHLSNEGAQHVNYDKCQFFYFETEEQNAYHNIHETKKSAHLHSSYSFPFTHIMYTSTVKLHL